MARTTRLIIPDSIIHAYCHSQDHLPLFGERALASWFDETLFSLAERNNWTIFAYVLLKNRYHILFRSPTGLISEPIKWRQSNFAGRYNRLYKRTGHVFYGRFRSMVVESLDAARGLIDQLHLAPAREGLCELADLPNYPFSSYPKYWTASRYPSLDSAAFFKLTQLDFSRSAMRSYQLHLESLNANNPMTGTALDEQFCKGWYIGSHSGKIKTAHAIKSMMVGSSFATARLKFREIHAIEWKSALEKQLADRGIDPDQIHRDKKGAVWKVEIARYLKKNTTADNRWIAEELNMGHPNRVSMVVKCARPEQQYSPSK